MYADALRIVAAAASALVILSEKANWALITSRAVTRGAQKVFEVLSA